MGEYNPNGNPPMPQPQPTGGPPPYGPQQTSGTPGNTEIAPPTYDAQDPHPEYKAAYQSQYPPQQFPVQINQPATIAYPTHSATYYPTTVSTYNQGTSSTVVVHATGFSERPVTTQCSYCHQLVTSRVEYVTGSFTWMMCCLICLFCPLFCWLIPFCMIGMKDVYHYCPQCNHLMGMHSRL